MDLQLFATLSMGLLGILFGSFSNVCVHRIPLGQSIVTPGSHCPQCKNDIAWYDNIPLISWVLLGRKCRHCNLAISWRYPLLELSMGGLWALITWFTPIAPQTSVYLLQAIVLVSLLWILTLIDLETFLLPNALTFPGIASGLLFDIGFELGGTDLIDDGLSAEVIRHDFTKFYPNNPSTSDILSFRFTGNFSAIVEVTYHYITP